MELRSDAKNDIDLKIVYQSDKENCIEVHQICLLQVYLIKSFCYVNYIKKKGFSERRGWGWGWGVVVLGGPLSRYKKVTQTGKPEINKRHCRETQALVVLGHCEKGLLNFILKSS